VAKNNERTACQAKNHIMYLKTHKCASSSLQVLEFDCKNVSINQFKFRCMVSNVAVPHLGSIHWTNLNNVLRDVLNILVYFQK